MKFSSKEEFIGVGGRREHLEWIAVGGRVLVPLSYLIRFASTCSLASRSGHQNGYQVRLSAVIVCHQVFKDDGSSRCHFISIMTMELTVNVDTGENGESGTGEESKPCV